MQSITHYLLMGKNKGDLVNREKDKSIKKRTEVRSLAGNKCNRCLIYSPASKVTKLHKITKAYKT